MSDDTFDRGHEGIRSDGSFVAGMCIEQLESVLANYCPDDTPLDHGYTTWLVSALGRTTNLLKIGKNIGPQGHNYSAEWARFCIENRRRWSWVVAGGCIMLDPVEGKTVSLAYERRDIWSRVGRLLTRQVSTASDDSPKLVMDRRTEKTPEVYWLTQEIVAPFGSYNHLNHYYFNYLPANIRRLLIVDYSVVPSDDIMKDSFRTYGEIGD